MFSSKHKISEAMNASCSGDDGCSIDNDKTTSSNDQDFCSDVETPIPNNVKKLKKTPETTIYR